ncbi:hypothetical protein H0H92_012725 [Tricholoma furcatifolium]|nr:hypothetical protein H0H92_012725 [Tricholoma furcatifolium]
MSLSWGQRKLRLASLLKSLGNEDVEGLALDRILHGQSVIGKTTKTAEIDTLRFSDKDLTVAGALEYGQFGVQCSPQIERDILLQARKTDSQWAPHLLCAFQTTTHLNLVMDYAEGGNLWDVLESSPLDGRVKEADLMWWAPQLISAIHWCHSQGFAHRDIKPHNFVLTPEARVLLIDFGSAAPLLPPDFDGAQHLLKRYCLIPCGTCDYISPEILQAHEEALVALEMDDGELTQLGDTQGYGRETDWWSLGAMLYEMAYGCAPFFAKDIRQTYLRIIDHQKYLRFDRHLPISVQYQDFLHGLLTDAECRLGRHSIGEITDHPLFCEVDWTNLVTKRAPPDLHLPQFTYTEPANLAPSPAPGESQSQVDSYSQGFAFSALFQSSNPSSSPGLSILRSKSSPDPPRPIEEDITASFIGFSWGPSLDAFEAPERDEGEGEGHTLSYMNTPRPLRTLPTYRTPNPTYNTPRFSAQATPYTHHDRYSTPVRPNALSVPATLLRTGTILRTAERRTLTDREAMKQLVDCVGMSARKKVLESGRKPRLLTRSRSANISANGTVTLTRKELRFDANEVPIPPPSLVDLPGTSAKAGGPLLRSRSLNTNPPKSILTNPQQMDIWSGSEDTDSEGPPSPSPTPRPGSAMSTLSRRSGTPTVGSMRMGMLGTTSSSSTMLLGAPTNMSGRSLSFSRSCMDLSESFRSQLAEESVPPASVTLEDMEDRLVTMLNVIGDVERRLAR